LARFRRAFGISRGEGEGSGISTPPKPPLGTPLDYNTHKAESRKENNFVDKNNDFSETFDDL